MAEPAYEAPGVQLYCGDMHEILDGLAGDWRADCCLTDFPYGNTTTEGARSLIDGVPEDRVAKAIKPFTAAATVRALDVIARRVDRWIVAFVDWTHADVVRQNPPRGWDFVRLGVWCKTNSAPQMTGDRPAQGLETMVILHRKGTKRWNSGGHKAWWVHPIAQKREPRGMPRRNPTEKPVSLMGELIADFATPGGLILDPMCGTGTTLVAAKLRGYPSVGIDLRQSEIDDAITRVRQEVLPFTHRPVQLGFSEQE